MSARVRNYYLVATASWFMAFGMQSVVFAWLVTIVLHEDAEFVGWAQTALLIPGMLLILLAGALADRIGPDRQALWAQLFAALIPWLLILALANGLLSYPVMIVYALAMGCAQAFVTPARDGLLNHVSGGDVQRTVLLASLSQFSFQILGYLLAGLADSVGAALILGTQSVVLLVGVIAYVLLRRTHAVPPAPQQQSMVAGVVQGARTVMGSPVMRIVVLQNVAMACFFMGCFIVCFPLVVREVYMGSSGDLGVMSALNSSGLVVTILVMLKVGYVQRPGRALILAQMMGALVLGLSGTMSVFAGFLTAIFCWGICGGIAMPMSRTLMQELAPPEQRARVMSFYAFSFMGAGPIGTVFCGYLSKLLGPQLAIVTCGSAMFLVTIMMILFSRLWRVEFNPQAQAA
ncbi:MAG: MFS transporter [Pseudomonadota bacterium]